MVQGVPYTHWKIKDIVDLSEIDPVYLWGTVVETDKGPLDQPVFITNADQAKKIFNKSRRHGRIQEKYLHHFGRKDAPILVG